VQVLRQAAARVLVTAAVVGAGAMATAVSASAGTITFTATADYDAFAPGVMHFTATTPLCSGGAFVASWQAETLGTVRSPVIDVFSGHTNNVAWDHIPTGRWSGTDTYVCGDGSGSFTIDWQGVGRIFEGSGVFGTFRIVGGTGAYAGLRGGGALFLIIYPAGGPHLELTGQLVGTS
jgi:hypothetical protein